MSVVYALATPASKSAICIFRVTGDGCLDSLEKLFGTSDISPRVFSVRPFYNSGLLVDTVGVLVFANGEVENRVFCPPLGQAPSQIREAVNFLNAIGQGRTLQDLKSTIVAEIEKHRSELDVLTTGLVEAGVAVMQDAGGDNERLIVRGRSNLLETTGTAEDLERVRVLFDDLERKRDIAEFLQLTDEAEGVRIFIGSENKLFSLSGSSLVVSPYMNADQKVVGAIGVIGPTRLNYGRIVPIVNYTAQMVGRVLSDRG